MKKMFIMIVFTALFLFGFEVHSRTYMSKTLSNNGITCDTSFTDFGNNLFSTYRSTCKDSAGNVKFDDYYNFNSATYDSDGNLLSKRDMGNSRIAYILNEDGQVVAKQNGFEGPVVEKYEYTPTGKMLVRDLEGNLIGAYDDLLSYHSMYITTVIGARDTSIEQLIGDTNLTESDGRFEDYDEDGNPVGIYYVNGSKKIYNYSTDGDFTVFEYDKNGVTLAEYDSNGYKKSYIYDENGDYTIRGEDGKFLGHFMADGSKRRKYTVNEAVAVLKGNNKNTFSIKYR